MNLRAAACVALCAGMVALSGCKSGPSSGSGAGSSGPQIAGAPTFRIITNGISPFWDSMGKGIAAAAAQVHCNASWQGPNPADHNAQVRIFQDAVAAKVDGIAVSAIEADALAPTINAATAAGVPVITFDSDSAKSNRLAYIGTNNYQAGRVAGAEAIKLFPHGARLVAFVGNMSAENARDRYNGFVDGVKGHNITFLQPLPYEDNKDKGRARQNVEDAIAKYQGRIDGFLGLYSYNGPAIADAVRAAGLSHKVKIVCFDGEPETLQNLSDGMVDATVVQTPYQFGRLSILLLYYLHRDKSIQQALAQLQPELDKLHMKRTGSVIDTGVEVVTPANAGPFLAKLKAEGLSST